MRQQERIVAEIIRAAGAYRWVGIYEIDHRRQRVVNPAWSGPGAPAHPEFPLSGGLTGRAIAERRTVSVGDVSRDASYLLAFPDTRSEVIVPIFASDATTVIGTIDVESDRENAFDRATEASLERVQLGGKAFLSSTLLDGRFWLRACIVNPRASRDDIDILVAAVRAAAEAETCVP